jgi:hypothetical protein
MLINVLATTALCLTSYHLFVRFTAVGRLLKGARHPSFFGRPRSCDLIPHPVLPSPGAALQPHPQTRAALLQDPTSAG